MVFKSRAASIAATIALLASVPAFAQPTPVIVLAFSGLDSVPIDPWTSVAAALLIAVIAGLIIRRKVAGGSMGPGLWSVAIAAVAVAATVGLPLDVIRVADAISAPTPLVTSPVNIAIGGGPAFVVAQNATSRNITITSVTLTNPAANQSIEGPPNTTCVPGLVLVPGQTCNISVVTLS